MTAYYNEINLFAAETLRNLIAAGIIAPGDVDTRSIVDVKPDDLRPYTQCHFFAGVGVWSYALRLAGWPDSRRVWTGSCPCQPFSTAGKGTGFDDERHLWPYWQWLIQECNPAELFGEQVASKDADPWIDLVQADLEAMGYAFGCVPFPSAGIGAPHIRDRAYWVGYSERARLQRLAGDGHGWHEPGRIGAHQVGPTAEASGALRLADGTQHGERAFNRQPCASVRQQKPIGGHGIFSGMADADSARLLTGDGDVSTARHGHPATSTSGYDRSRPAGPTNGFWADADWLFCRDGKWRPVEPGTFPLADGAPARVGRLRAYGNAINAEAAKAFIECFMEIDGTVITP